MTVVSKPVPTFKPSWLRKGNPSRGRRPKTPRTFRQLCEAFGTAPSADLYRRQPKGRRAKSGQWWRRTPCPVRVGVAVGLEHGKIRMAEQRRLFPDYFKGEPPQATYNPNRDQGAW